MFLAIFDLCGTLYRCNTLFCFTRWLCPKNRNRILADSYLGYLADELFPRRQWRRRQHLQALSGFRQDELRYYGAKFVREILPPLQRESAAALLHSLQQAGWETILASAAPDFLTEPAARLLRFDQWHSPHYQNGMLENDIFGRKEQILSEVPPWERLLVCTDNCSDEALLRRADERVIYTSKRHEQWWLARFPAQDVHRV